MKIFCSIIKETYQVQHREHKRVDKCGDFKALLPQNCGN